MISPLVKKHRRMLGTSPVCPGCPNKMSTQRLTVSEVASPSSVWIENLLHLHQTDKTAWWWYVSGRTHSSFPFIREEGDKIRIFPFSVDRRTNLKRGSSAPPRVTDRDRSYRRLRRPRVLSDKRRHHGRGGRMMPSGRLRSGQTDRQTIGPRRPDLLSTQTNFVKSLPVEINKFYITFCQFI